MSANGRSAGVPALVIFDAFGKNGFRAFALAHPTLFGAAAAALGWWRFRRGDLP